MSLTAERVDLATGFRQQAVLRAVKDGVPVVARELGLEPAQLYAWRAKAQQRGEDAEAQRLMQAEHARLKRDVARLEEEVCDALRMALFRRKRPHGVIMHTDRGSQYCSREHRALLDESGLVASMSARATATTMRRSKLGPQPQGRGDPRRAIRHARAGQGARVRVHRG